jgi:AbrB family looped-hinge helix DNA binding protein
MKRDLIPIDKAGRIVLPKPLRKKLSLLPGDKLSVTVEGNSIKLEPAAGGGGGLVRKGTVLVFRGLAGTIRAVEVEELIDQDREVRMAAPRTETENQ